MNTNNIKDTHDKSWSWAQRHRPLIINLDAIVDALFFAFMFFLFGTFLVSN